MRNACPTCQTVYAVTPADVGRRITCTKCNATLVIDADGFRLADGTGGGKAVPVSSSKRDPDDRRRSRRDRDDRDDTGRERGRKKADDEDTVDADERPAKGRNRGNEDDDDDDSDNDADQEKANAVEMLKRYVDVPTTVFAVGLLVVLWFAFAPVIGSANARWYAARIEDEQLAQETEVARLKDKGESTVKLEEEWRKRKEKLQHDEKQENINNRKAEWWHRLGVLVGFLVAAAGAVGLLMTHQPRAKKVVGAVVVLAVVVLVFLSFVGKFSASVGLG